MKSPACAFESDGPHLAVQFHHRDGTVYGFPYAHLLNFHCHANPDVERQPHAPPQIFLLTFSTHEVSLLGWQLKTLVPALSSGKLASLHALDARYQGLAPTKPFISDMHIRTFS